MCNLLSVTLTNRHLQMLRELHGLEILHSVVQSTSVSWCLEWAFYMYNSLKEHKHSPSLIIYILYKQPLVTTTTTTTTTTNNNNIKELRWKIYAQQLLYKYTHVYKSVKQSQDNFERSLSNSSKTIPVTWMLVWGTSFLFCSIYRVPKHNFLCQFSPCGKNLLSISVKCNTVKFHL